MANTPKKPKGLKKVTPKPAPVRQSSLTTHYHALAAHANALTAHALALSAHAEALHAAAVLVASDTETKVKKIVASYGIVPNPTSSTIVGPAVVSMNQFTMDVNLEFGRSYVIGQLKSTWTINQTANYIDNNP